MSAQAQKVSSTVKVLHLHRFISSSLVVVAVCVPASVFWDYLSIYVSDSFLLQALVPPSCRPPPLTSSTSVPSSSAPQ